MASERRCLAMRPTETFAVCGIEFYKNSRGYYVTNTRGHSLLVIREQDREALKQMAFVDQDEFLAWLHNKQGFAEAK